MVRRKCVLEAHVLRTTPTDNYGIGNSATVKGLNTSKSASSSAQVHVTRLEEMQVTRRRLGCVHRQLPDHRCPPTIGTAISREHRHHRWYFHACLLMLNVLLHHLSSAASAILHGRSVLQPTPSHAHLARYRHRLRISCAAQ